MDGGNEGITGERRTWVSPEEELCLRTSESENHKKRLDENEELASALRKKSPDSRMRVSRSESE
ncbi:hypothetical protein M569_14176 [Genlisea aurea]|uniref:Uncharacterized protein n=1 Tax=Genlisea aurea TaxID=192259 RepID=S8DLZ4_9LAMI|nr:hypothetical protein M569_14176 [Genlisea aurea]